MRCYRAMLVVALAPNFDDPREEVLEALRAELRGLGAALLLIGTDHSFCFRPDDELVEEPSTAELRLWAIQLFRSHGVGPQALAPGMLLLGCCSSSSRSTVMRMTGR